MSHRRTPGRETLAMTILITELIIGLSAISASADTPLDSQVTLTNVDPAGNGKSTFTVYYHVMRQAQVGTPLVVPVKLYVANLTGLMSFLQDYTVKVTLSLNNGKVVSGQAGVNSTQAAENLGAGQLHAGQEWGPTNITIPLTESNTGMTSGQEALGNATLRVDADVWFNSPIDFYRPEGSQSSAGFVVISDGTPAGPSPNYGGFGILVVGVALLAVSFMLRSKSSNKGTGSGPKKAPGSV